MIEINRCSAKIQRINLFLCILVSTFCLTGCGGGGGAGDGSSNPVGPNPSTFNGEPLSYSGASLEKAFSNGALILSLPAASNKEKYAVLLENNGDSATTIVAKGLSKSGSIRASMAPAAVPSKLKPPCGTIHVRNVPKNRLSSALRANMASTRASTLSEEVGQVVPFEVYNFSYTDPYKVRYGILRRVSEHCKIFVDKDEYWGLSAAGGTYAVTEDQIAGIAYNFENTIYKLMTENYGEPYDIDGDGKVAILISPLVTRNRLAGFFNSEDFLDDYESNHRDILYLWSPSSGWDSDEWFKATCETVAHEFQHLINHSERLKKADYPPQGLPDSQCENAWLDEGLSVGAEIRYRLALGDPATENRFEYYCDYISSTVLTNCFVEDASLTDDEVLAEYGCVGLFAHYLLEQGGSGRIKALIQSGLKGEKNIENAFQNHEIAALRSFDGIESNWKKALLAELVRPKIDMSKISAYQKYIADFDLDNQLLNYDFETGVPISPGVLAAFTLGGGNYTFEVKTGATAVNCVVMRLND